MTHTPGPWSACGDGKCSCKTVTSEHHPIAKVTCGTWGDDFPAIRLVGTSTLDQKAEAYMEQFTYGEVGEDSARANALLIAAAPAMLEALKTLRSIIDEGDIPRYSIRPGAVLNAFVEEVLDPTLRKAEGR